MSDSKDDEKLTFHERAKKERGEVDTISYELTKTIKSKIKMLFLERTFNQVHHSTREGHLIEIIPLKTLSKLRENLGIEDLQASKYAYDPVLGYTGGSEKFFKFLKSEARDRALVKEETKDKRMLGVDFEWTALEELCVITLEISESMKNDDVKLLFKKLPYDFIKEVNDYLKQGSIGYHFCVQQKMFIRTSTPEFYDRVTRPSIEILSKKKEYKVANESLEKALKSSNEMKYDDCLTHLGTSIESVFRQITGDNNPRSNIQDLIKKFIEKNKKLQPHQSVLSALPKFLESVNAIRNRSGSAHPKKEEPTDNLTSFALHMTASILIFLISSSEENKI